MRNLRRTLPLACCKVGLDRPLIPAAFVANLFRSARVSRPRRSAVSFGEGLPTPPVGPWFGEGLPTPPVGPWFGEGLPTPPVGPWFGEGLPTPPVGPWFGEGLPTPPF